MNVLAVLATQQSVNEKNNEAKKIINFSVFLML